MCGINFSKICKDYGISVYSYQSNPGLVAELNLDTRVSGYAVTIGDKPAIIFDENRPKEEQLFTIAHELAHILLGHLSYRIKNKECHEFHEREADTFATVLAAYAILGRYCEREVATV